MKVTTDHLLYQNATSTARNWARYLAESVTDLEQIARRRAAVLGQHGVLPGRAKDPARSSATRSSIAKDIPSSCRIADKVALVDLSEFSADAARSMRIGQADRRREGRQASRDLPSFFAQAYVPVIVDGERRSLSWRPTSTRPKQRDEFSNTFLIAAASLCLLTGLSFAIPAIAWYRRTKEKQQADRRIRFLAHHDALTGLANRASLIERLEKALAVAVAAAAASPCISSTSTASRRSTTRLATTAATSCSRRSPSGCAR